MFTVHSDSLTRNMKRSFFPVTLFHAKLLFYTSLQTLRFVDSLTAIKNDSEVGHIDQTDNIMSIQSPQSYGTIHEGNVIHENSDMNNDDNTNWNPASLLLGDSNNDDDRTSSVKSLEGESSLSFKIRRQKRRQEVQVTIQSKLQFTLIQCIIAIIIYLLIAIISFSYVFEHWTMIDSMYFGVVTFTTIGYGDLAPNTFIGKLFTCIFAMSGIATLGIALGVLGTNVMDAHDDNIENLNQLEQSQAMTLFNDNNVSMKTDPTEQIKLQSNINDSDQRIAMEISNSTNSPPTFTMPPIIVNQRWSGLVHIGWKLIVVFVILWIFAIILVLIDPGIDLNDALYFTVVTATTVGYGDYAPQSQLGRFIAIIFIPIAVGSMGHWLSVVATYIIEQKHIHFHKQLLKNDLSLSDIDIMDADGDGTVSYNEFLEFMLIAMNKIDEATLIELRHIFNRLDTDHSGHLSRRDLMKRAKNNLLHNPEHRQIQLEKYKQKTV